VFLTQYHLELEAHMPTQYPMQQQRVPRVTIPPPNDENLSPIVTEIFLYIFGPLGDKLSLCAAFNNK